MGFSDLPKTQRTLEPHVAKPFVLGVQADDVEELGAIAAGREGVDVVPPGGEGQDSPADQGPITDLPDLEGIGAGQGRGGTGGLELLISLDRRKAALFDT